MRTCTAPSCRSPTACMRRCAGWRESCAPLPASRSRTARPHSRSIPPGTSAPPRPRSRVRRSWAGLRTSTAAFRRRPRRSRRAPLRSTSSCSRCAMRRRRSAPRPRPSTPRALALPSRSRTTSTRPGAGAVVACSGPGRVSRARCWRATPGARDSKPRAWPARRCTACSAAIPTGRITASPRASGGTASAPPASYSRRTAIHTTEPHPRPTSVAEPAW